MVEVHVPNSLQHFAVIARLQGWPVVVTYDENRCDYFIRGPFGYITHPSFVERSSTVFKVDARTKEQYGRLLRVTFTVRGITEPEMGNMKQLPHYRYLLARTIGEVWTALREIGLVGGATEHSVPPQHPNTPCELIVTPNPADVAERPPPAPQEQRWWRSRRR